jgi:hypothetical protein
MLFFVTTAAHRYTIDNYRSVWGASLSPAVISLPYERLFCRRALPSATYVFSDFDRLSSRDLERAGVAYSSLKEQGARVYNDPRKYRFRLELLNSLHQIGTNQFNAYEPLNWRMDRFPVFLRRNHGHEGPLTDLLWSEKDVSEGLLYWSRRYSDIIIVEYLDYRDENGRCWKHSRFRAGSSIIPAGIVSGRSWCLKAAELVDEPGLQAESQASQDKSLDAILMQCFQASGVEFGRIDYTLVDGRVQVFEVNTNPDLGVPCSERLQRWALRTQYYSQLNQILWQWATDSTGPERLILPARLARLADRPKLIYWTLYHWARRHWLLAKSDRTEYEALGN